MSTERRRRLRRVQRDGSGRALCRWCGAPVAPPRRTFCSDACVHEWRIRSDPGYVRQLLSRRDHGVCATCGRQATAWEAHHVVPVAEGGGDCGLEGYVTLCRACHWAESAQLARRRAEVRRMGPPEPPLVAEGWGQMDPGTPGVMARGE